MICLVVGTGILYTPFLLRAEQVPKAPRTVIHPHKDGGFVAEWLVLGPFPNAKDDSAGLAYDFLRAMGGEEKAIIKNYSAIRVKGVEGKRKFIRVKKVIADSGGIVSLDSFFTDTSGETIYAFCMVEAFIPCSVRCYWGVDGGAKLWLNGLLKKNKWDCCDTCLPVSKYVDAFFNQGYNSVLIKFTDKKPHQRFTFAVWDLRDSLIPFQKRITSLHCDLDTFEVNSAEDSITTTIRFNVPVPAHFFTGEIKLYKDAMDAAARRNVMSYSVPVNKPFAVSIPDSFQRVLAISAQAKPDKERSLVTTRYVWRGNFGKTKDSLREIFKKLDPGQNRDAPVNPFVKLFVAGIYNWGADWFTISDSLSIDEQVRQLGYVQTSAEIVNSILDGKELAGGKVYPLYLPDVGREAVGDSAEYEASRWLNYKYPERYKLPHSISNASEYRFWLFLPKSIAKQRKRIPLILALSGADIRGYDINAIKKFGPGGYAQEVTDFPFAVITPLCRYNTLWEPHILKRLLDTFLASGRFKKRKIFITGTGMGAFTAWHLASTFPEYITAIVPINGGGEEEKACTLTNVSIWAFHGAKNRIVPLEITQEMVNAVKECGGKKIKFSIYPEDDHSMYQKVFSDPSIYQWLKRQ